MAIVDMGLRFDGKCCVCREWINPGDKIAQVPEGEPHDVAHLACAEKEDGD